MKEGQTGKYGVWLSECCTDRHRQHARRGLDGSAAAAAAAAEEWNNTSHFVEAATAAGAIQKQQRQALHITVVLCTSCFICFSALHSWILARSLSHSRTYP